MTLTILCVQTFRMTKRPRRWPRFGRGPHAAALLLSKNSDRPLVCSEQRLPDPKCAPERYPTLEELLCSLVYRANHPGEKYPVPKNKQCEAAPKPTGIGAWFRDTFGRGRGSEPLSDKRSLPESMITRAAPFVQRGTETLGTIAAANWLWRRLRP